MLEKGLIKLGLDIDEKLLALLTKYIEEIELFNPAYGLIKVKDRNELVVKHILDSLAPLQIIRDLQDKAVLQNRQAEIADVGSGAGLPGIPLALCLPGAEFTLVERMARRAGFLRNVQALLGLANVRVEEAEMESISPGQFDLVVFRAFRPFTLPIFKGLIALLKPEGIIAAYKGRLESIDEEMTALRSSIGNRRTLTWEILPLEVPFLNEERHLVLIPSLS